MLPWKLRMSTKVRLLAVDIDGTLLDSYYQIPARNLQALVAAHESGIEVVLVTGRRFTFALPVAEQIPFDHVLICSNGAVIKSRSGQSFCRHLLPRETAAQAIAWTCDWRDYTMLAFDVEGEGEIVIESLQNRTDRFLAWYERNSRYVRFQPLEEALTTDPLQVMYSGPVAVLSGIEQSLLAAPFCEDFKLLKTFYEARDLGIVDLINKGCSKGAALAEWVQRRGFTRDRVMAVGDNFNDLEMLEFAGVPVVMGNAVPELKSDGRRVTLDNDSAGLALAIEQWAL